MKSIILAVALGLATFTVIPGAVTASAQQTELPWVKAQVTKVDIASGRIALRHEDIPNLDMPGMAMAFRVADPTMLDAVKAGDAVRVSIDKVKGQLTIVRMQSVR